MENINSLGKIPPQAVDVEEIVLGILLLEHASYYRVSNQLNPDIFYRNQNQVIYNAIKEVHDSGKNCNIISVTKQLKSTGFLELTGGAFYVTELTRRVASGEILEEMVAIIYQEYIKRNLINFSMELQQMAFDDSTDAFDVLSFAQSGFEKIENISSNDNFRTISDCIKESIKETDAKAKAYKEGKPSGIPSCLYRLNKMTGGWQKGDLIIVAGRPGMGKTALMLNDALAAAKAGFSVCIYSLEMTPVSLINRLILCVSGVDALALKTGNMSDYDYSEYNNAVTMLEDLPIYIDPNPLVSMRYIRSNSRIMKMKGRCDLVMIDYLQLTTMKSENRNRNREQEVSESSRMSKIIAKELDIPVILLSQLNRTAESTKDKRPTMSMLRESGSLEQDADMVLLTYRPEYYNITETEDGTPTNGYGELIVDKHRSGSVGTVKFAYNETVTLITDYNQGTDYRQEPVRDITEPMKPNRLFDDEAPF